MDIPFDELAWPLTKEERDEYGKRVIKEYDKDPDDYMLSAELSVYGDSPKEIKDEEDMKSRDYLDMSIPYDDFGAPRNKEEAYLQRCRFYNEPSFYNDLGDE